MSIVKSEDDEHRLQIFNQIYANSEGSNQHRQFQPEELTYILETYVNNLDSFRRSGHINSKEVLRPRKDVIREIAETCTAMGHSVRTEKQIEQKLRDELKKLRKFNNEVQAHDLKISGNTCVYPRASRGTIFLYNKLILNQPENPAKTAFENLEAILNSLNQNNFKDQTPPLISSEDGFDLIKSSTMMETLQNLVTPQDSAAKSLETEFEREPSKICRKRIRKEEIQLPMEPKEEEEEEDVDDSCSMDQQWKKERIKTELCKQKYYRLKANNQILLSQYLRRKMELLVKCPDNSSIPSPIADDLEMDSDNE